MTQLSTDLHNMLADELEHLDDEQRALDARRAAIKLLMDHAPKTIPEVLEEPPEPIVRKRRAKIGGRGRGKRANLDDAALADIRAQATGGKAFATIGAMYNISRSTVSNVVARKGRYA